MCGAQIDQRPTHPLGDVHIVRPFTGLAVTAQRMERSSLPRHHGQRRNLIRPLLFIGLAATVSKEGTATRGGHRITRPRRTEVVETHFIQPSAHAAIRYASALSGSGMRPIWNESGCMNEPHQCGAEDRKSTRLNSTHSQ